MIPTRDELIKRIADCQWNGMVQVGTAVSFTDAEIRRAVADELDELRADFDRRGLEGVPLIDARLAALRAEQTEQPPGSSTERARADAAPQNSARREPAPQGQDAGSTPAPGISEDGLERAWDRMRAQESGHYETAGVTGPGSESVKVRDGLAAPALSDADVLERARNILRALGRHSDAQGALLSEEAKLRASSAPVPVPKPVDVFEAFDAAWHKEIQTYREEAETVELARDWFGPLAAALEKIEVGSDDPLAVSIAGEALAALRRRASDASQPPEGAIRQRAQEASR